MTEDYYQQVARGDWYLHFVHVKLEDAVSVVYTAKELNDKYGTRDARFGLSAEWYRLGTYSEFVFIQLGAVLGAAIDAFKDPKVKFFPVELPSGFDLVQYREQLQEIGLGHTTTKGGGFVRKAKPDYTKPNGATMLELKHFVATEIERMLSRDYHMEIDIKATRNYTAMNNLVVMSKKFGLKQIPTPSFNGHNFRTLLDFIEWTVTQYHPKFANNKVYKAAEKELKLWWKGANEVLE